jgi:restriction system protein
LQRVQQQADFWGALLRKGISECIEFDADLSAKLNAILWRTVGKKAAWDANEAELEAVREEHRSRMAEPLRISFNKLQALSESKKQRELIGSGLAIADELRADYKVGKAFAFLRTATAQGAQTELATLLAGSPKVDPALEWRDLVDIYDPPRPVTPELKEPPPPVRRPAPPEPDWTDIKRECAPKFTLFDWFDSARRQTKIAEASAHLEERRRRWLEECAQVDAENEAALLKRDNEVSELRLAHSKMLEALERERTLKVKMRALRNELILALEKSYVAGESEAGAAYCEAVLINSRYPDYLPHDVRLAYTGQNGLLVVDYALPSPRDIPALVEVKLVKSTQKYTEKYLPDTKRAQLYDDVVYQIVLRTLAELFRSDKIGALKSIVLNGIVTSRDRATGKEAVACILSIQVSREEFQEIDLANVDPKACFRKLKGVGSAKLHSITAVAPIVQLETDDPRLIESHAVGESLDAGSNLAAMDWEEFEHFIREIFEKEFVSPGSQVRVTRASRDGGVDAIVFDPDPIRGGKIVIQAKRYTNTVGVSAVRDLYGTVLNEGASKGILVTTSDYGPDAYEFAAGKPLTLLSGSNLLHLLSKHGIRAHIDLLDAKRLASEDPHNSRYSPRAAAAPGNENPNA